MLRAGVLRKLLHCDCLKFHSPLKVFELNLDCVDLTIKIFDLVPHGINTSFQGISPLGQ